MQIIPFTVLANQAIDLSIPGTYFYYAEGDAGGADSTIIIKEDAHGLTVTLKPGQAMRLPLGSRQAVRWYIQNYANAATITGKVVIGNGEITDNRITGQVEVIDGGKSRVKARDSFIGGSYSGAVAAQYSYVQLWNPPGSGINAVVNQVNYSTAALAGIYLAYLAAPGVTDISAQISNKFIGAGAGGVQLRRGSNAALLGVYFDYVHVPARSPQILRFSDPMIIPPNQGILIQCDTVNVENAGVFEWYEESV